MIYEAMRLMKERVQENFKSGGQVWMESIKKRWEDMLSHPLHKAAYYLNPKYHYKLKLGTQSPLLAALQEVVERQVKSIDKQTACMNEVKYFREGLGSFGRATAVNGRNKTLPSEWWILYGSDAPNLQDLAVKILSQTASAGGCERNWSTFNLIHSKRRNSLGAQRLHDLVYIHYNLRLKMKHAREGQNKEDYMDPIDLAYIFKIQDDDDEAEEDVLQEWMNGNGAPVLDEGGGRPNSTIASQMRADVDDFLARSGRFPDPVEGLESEDEDSFVSRSKTTGDGGGDDDDDATGGAVLVRGGAGTSGGDPEFDARVRAGEEYMARETNVHGQYIPPGPSHGGHGSTPAGRMQMDWDWQAPQAYPWNPHDAIMDDLTSSVGSMSMDFGNNSFFTGGATSGYSGISSAYSGHGSHGHGPRPGYPVGMSMDFRPRGPQHDSSSSYWQGSQLYEDTSQSGYGSGAVAGGSSGFGIFPDYPMEPPFQQPQPPPSVPAPSSSSRGSRAASSSRQPPRDSASSQDRYPRIGFLAYVTDHEYNGYLMDYRTMYSYMTWADYVEYRDRARSNDVQEVEPARNSWFW